MVWSIHADVVRLLVERGARLDMRDTIYDGTPLDWAVYGGRTEIAEFLRERETIKHFISNEEARSFTVVPVEANEALVTSIKARAKKSDILLGEGYGDWKSSTFRIANFPAIRKKEIKTLQDFLAEY